MCVHTSHCNQGEYIGQCKYGEDSTCPALPAKESQEQIIRKKCKALYDQMTGNGAHLDWHTFKRAYHAGYNQAVQDSIQ